MKRFLAVCMFFILGCGGGSGDDSQLSILADFPLPVGTAGAGFHNGDLYVFGGSVNYNGDSNYSSIYKLTGATWTAVDTMMNDKTWDGKLLMNGDEAYYVAGWNGVNSSLQKYNFTSHVWTSLAAGHISQNWGTTAQLLNNKIYHFGSNGQVDIYDIPGGTWVLADTNRLTRNNEYALTSIVYQGDIYVTGYGDSSLYKYNITANEFTLESYMPRSICGAAMAQVNGKIYMISGSFDSNAPNVYSDSYVYDLVNKSWTPYETNPITPIMYPAAVLSGNALYIIGGFDLNENGTTGSYSIALN